MYMPHLKNPVVALLSSRCIFFFSMGAGQHGHAPGHAVLLSAAALWDWPRAVLFWFGDGASTTRGHLAVG